MDSQLACQQHRGSCWRVNFIYERKQKLPAHKAGGRYKGNPHNGREVL
jgi:hypothetical protein